MNIQLSGHAEEQILERELDRDQVIAVALAPEQIVYPANKPPVAQSRFLLNNKQYLLRVAFRDEGDTRIVITVYPTSQLRKYWKKETGHENQV